MASVFQSYRLFIDTKDVPYTTDMVKDIEAFGNAIIAIDGDLAVIVTEHKGDTVFSSVGIELESNPGTFANLIHEYFNLSESISGRLIVESILE